MNDSYSSAVPAAAGPYEVVVALFWLATLAVLIVAMWKLLTKAGRPGWAAIVPFYNTYVMLQIVGRPGWWLLLLFLPLINLVVALILAIDLAKSFGRDSLFGVVGLFLFGPVGYLILAFGGDRYLGPSVGAGQAVAPSVNSPA